MSLQEDGNEHEQDDEVPEWSTKAVDEWTNEDVIDWCKYNGFLSVLSRLEGKFFFSFCTHRLWEGGDSYP